MADEKAGSPGHEPEEIRSYIDRRYPEMRNAKDVSIWLLGGVYRVAVIDQSNINHTLKIDPKSIDAERALQAKVDVLRAKQAQKTPRPENAKDHDLDREP